MPTGPLVGEMLERTGVTYVLTIQPDQLPDGTYHTLKVETKGLPRGARVVHRPGYYAPKPYALRSPTERMLQTAGQVLAGAEGGLVRTSALVVPLPATAETGATADVPVVWVPVRNSFDSTPITRLSGATITPGDQEVEAGFTAIVDLAIANRNCLP